MACSEPDSAGASGSCLNSVEGKGSLSAIRCVFVLLLPTYVAPKFEGMRTMYDCEVLLGIVIIVMNVIELTGAQGAGGW